MSEIAVELKNICFSYEEGKSPDEKLFALDDVSFTANVGEYVALIGHNGSGKSTIAKIIAGILEIRKGQLFIFNEELVDENVRSLQKNIGMVFQNPDNQFIGASVQEDIAFGLENDCVAREEMVPLIEEFAKKVGMSDFLNREPTSLSGGQKQRVAIAGTLVRKPRILLLDEATSMLDPKGKREIRNLIQAMKEENPELTIISITHDIEEAYQADRVIVMNKGRIEMSGTPKEVFVDYERLKEIDLDIPFFLQLKNRLDAYGIDIEGVSNIKGLVQKLCK